MDETNHPDHSTAQATENGTTENPPISLDAALEVMEGDLDILKSVVEAFVQETPEILQDLEDAIQLRDARAAQRAAHTVKGSFRILQQDELQKNWGNLEAMARDGKFDELTQPVAAARTRAEQIVEQLNQFLASN